jgi:hypothetical protein
MTRCTAQNAETVYLVKSFASTLGGATKLDGTQPHPNDANAKTVTNAEEISR